MIYINDQINQIDIRQALAVIPSYRREQALRFKHEQGQRLCVAAYLLLHEALMTEYGITEYPRFEYGEHGKPFLADYPDIYFNLSHCQAAAACVIGDHPVGIDIEQITRYKESLVRYVMNEDEIAEINRALRPDVAFIKYWTMKEALMKTSGQGISNDMKNVLRGDEPFVTIINQAKGYVCTALM